MYLNLKIVINYQIRYITLLAVNNIEEYFGYTASKF